MEKIEQLQNLYNKIELLSDEADKYNDIAKSDTKHSIEFNKAAQKYEELANTYEQYYALSKETGMCNKYLLTIKANMFHEKFDSNTSYGQYFELIMDYERATPFYIEAMDNIQKSVSYISDLLRENLSEEERKSAECDFKVWSLDVLLNKCRLTNNGCQIALKEGNFSIAFDKTEMTINIMKQIEKELESNSDYIEIKDKRRYKASTEALMANLFTINSFQSESDYCKTSNFNDYFDILLYLIQAYEYTNKAIKVDNFWSEYKEVRNNLYSNIQEMLYSCKRKWTIILQKSNNNTTLMEIMEITDRRYYKKITHKREGGSMIFFKNTLKSNGNIIINHGNNNTNISDTQIYNVLSSDDISETDKLAEHIKKNCSDELSKKELEDIIIQLKNISKTKTNEQLKYELNNWKTLKANIGDSGLKFISMCAELATIGDFLKQLLGI